MRKIIKNQQKELRNLLTQAYKKDLHKSELQIEMENKKFELDYLMKEGKNIKNLNNNYKYL